MNLGHKVLALLLVVATVPPVTLGFILLRRYEDTLIAELRSRHTWAVSESARALDELLRQRLATSVRLARAGQGALLQTECTVACGQVLDFVQSQLPESALVLLLDGAGQVQRLSRVGAVPGAASMEGAALGSVVDSVVKHPLARLAEVPLGVAAGPVIHTDRGGVSLAPLVIDIGVVEGQRRFVVVLLVLPMLFETAVQPGARSPGLRYIDDNGVGIWPDRAPADSAQQALLQVPAQEAGSLRVQLPRGTVLLAFSRVRLIASKVILMTPEDESLAAAQQLRWLTLLGLLAAALLALTFGVVLSARLRRGVAQLDSAARAIGGGDLATRVQIDGDDELARLGHTVNTMAHDLSAAQEELRAFNRELQQRVEERTQELKLAIEKLHQTSKLAAVGQLGAGLAHELNNPLSGILGYAQSLLRSTDDADPSHKKLCKIENAAKRCAAITKDLLRFAQGAEVGRRERVTPDELLQQMMALAGTTSLKSGMEIELVVDPDLPTIEVESGQVIQVFISLLENAQTATAQVANPRLLVAVGAKGEEGEAVVFRFSDNGGGIAQDNLGRVFEPFFTTKEDWGSIGLGLTVAHRVVTEHCGTISIESTPQGTTVSVELPTDASDKTVPKELRAGATDGGPA